MTLVLDETLPSSKLAEHAVLHEVLQRLPWVDLVHMRGFRSQWSTIDVCDRLGRHNHATWVAIWDVDEAPVLSVEERSTEAAAAAHGARIAGTRTTTTTTKPLALPSLPRFLQQLPNGTEGMVVPRVSLLHTPGAEQQPLHLGLQHQFAACTTREMRSVTPGKIILRTSAAHAHRVGGHALGYNTPPQPPRGIIRNGDGSLPAAWQSVPHFGHYRVAVVSANHDDAQARALENATAHQRQRSQEAGLRLHHYYTRSTAECLLKAADAIRNGWTWRGQNKQMCLCRWRRHFAPDHSLARFSAQIEREMDRQFGPVWPSLLALERELLNQTIQKRGVHALLDEGVAAAAKVRGCL